MIWKIYVDIFLNVSHYNCSTKELVHFREEVSLCIVLEEPAFPYFEFPH